MNIYISSSWKNRERVRAMAIALREAGHVVYDFTDPACRKTPEIPPERFPEAFDPARHIYREYLDVPEWRAAVECNRAALDNTELVILMLPAGNDSHADWAYAVGRGVPSIVVGQPRAGDRTPSHHWARTLLDSDDAVVPWLQEVLSSPPTPQSAPEASAETEPQCEAVTWHGHRCDLEPHGDGEHEAEGAAESGGTLLWREEYAPVGGWPEPAPGAATAARPTAQGGVTMRDVAAYLLDRADQYVTKSAGWVSLSDAAENVAKGEVLAAKLNGDLSESLYERLQRMAPEQAQGGAGPAAEKGREP